MVNVERSVRSVRQVFTLFPVTSKAPVLSKPAVSFISNELDKLPFDRGRGEAEAAERAARSVAVLHSEDDLDLVQILGEASSIAAKDLNEDKTEADTAEEQLDPEILSNLRTCANFCKAYSEDCPFLGVEGALCNVLKIHERWD
jgi:hypothetical protein